MPKQQQPKIKDKTAAKRKTQLRKLKNILRSCGHKFATKYAELNGLPLPMPIQYTRQGRSRF